MRYLLILFFTLVFGLSIQAQDHKKADCPTSKNEGKAKVVGKTEGNKQKSGVNEAKLNNGSKKSTSAKNKDVATADKKSNSSKNKKGKSQCNMEATGSEEAKLNKEEQEHRGWENSHVQEEGVAIKEDMKTDIHKADDAVEKHVIGNLNDMFHSVGRKIDDAFSNGHHPEKEKIEE